MTPALQSQYEAKKARQQRFAEAARKYEQRKASERLETQVELIQTAVVSEPKTRRREYDTIANQTVFAPITWRILRAVSEEFEMPVSEMLSERQEPKYCIPRYVAAGLMLQLTNMSIPAIGKRLGGRDHATIHNARRRINEMLESEAFRNRFDQIKASIMSGIGASV